jgi:hypothetical protein
MCSYRGATWPDFIYQAGPSVQGFRLAIRTYKLQARLEPLEASIFQRLNELDNRQDSQAEKAAYGKPATESLR